jgi:hypothetical protein
MVWTIPFLAWKTMPFETWLRFIMDHLLLFGSSLYLVETHSKLCQKLFNKWSHFAVFSNFRHLCHSGRIWPT